MAVAMDLIRTSSPTKVTTTGPPLSNPKALRCWAEMLRRPAGSILVTFALIRYHAIWEQVDRKVVAEPFAHGQLYPYGPDLPVIPDLKLRTFCWRNEPYVLRSVILVFLALAGSQAPSGFTQDPW
jgi:hypothetical protein